MVSTTPNYLVLGNTGPTGTQGAQGVKGATGDTGDQGVGGPNGPKGPRGYNPTIDISGTATGAAGTQASVVQGGTDLSVNFFFTIPKGDKGDTGSIEASYYLTPGVPMFTLDPTNGNTFINGSLDVSGNSTYDKNLTINGTLKAGSLEVGSEVIVITDPILQLGSNNVDDNLDRGISFKYAVSDVSNIGFFGYDQTDNIFVFRPIATDTTTNVFTGALGEAQFGQISVGNSANKFTVADTTGNTVIGGTLGVTGNTTLGNLVGGSITSGFGTIDNGSSSITTTGAISGGTLIGTLQSVAQPKITSVGTLTELQVDNLNINGNTISSTAGTDLNITPLSGQHIVLDGAIIIDAGVVTGATSITSTAFAGALNGNAGTVTNGVYTTNNLSALASTTSLQLAGVISDETGSGSLVFATSPTLVTPLLGTPTSGDLSNCSGTAASLTAGAVTNGVYTTNNLSALASTTSLQLAGVISDETGTGRLVFATSPTLVTPVLGTPTSGDLSNCSGTAASLTAGNATTAARISLVSAPALATSAGIAGQIGYDVNWMYVCIASGEWRRSALATW